MRMVASVITELRRLQGLDAAAATTVRQALAEQASPAAPTTKAKTRSVSFSGAESLPAADVGTRSSRYDIRARRKRAAERRAAARELQPAGEPAEDDALARTGPKEWWLRQQWCVGNERQASQQAWRLERREAKLRPLASQPPFGKSAAAFRSDPVFTDDSRERIDAVAGDLGTSESFAATLVRQPRRRRRRVQLAPTKSLPDLAAGQGMRFIEAVNSIRSQLGLDKGLTPQEVVQQGCVQLGVGWRPEAATLKHGTQLLCDELGIATGWDETEMKTIRPNEIHPSWASPPAVAEGSVVSMAASSMASESSNNSDKLVQLRSVAREAIGSYSVARSHAQEAVGSYAKAATAKIKKDLGMTREQAADLKLARSAQPKGSQLPASTAAAKDSPGKAKAKGGPQWIGGMSEALDQAATGDRPVFVTTRPDKLQGKLAPTKGESFAFRASFILPQTRVLVKDGGGTFAPPGARPFSPCQE